MWKPLPSSWIITVRLSIECCERCRNTARSALTWSNTGIKSSAAKLARPMRRTSHHMIYSFCPYPLHEFAGLHPLLASIALFVLLCQSDPMPCLYIPDMRETETHSQIHTPYIRKDKRLLEAEELNGGEDEGHTGMVHVTRSSCVHRLGQKLCICQVFLFVWFETMFLLMESRPKGCFPFPTSS